MDVRNCKRCGRMFNYVDKPICPSCSKELDDKFVEVKEYIRDNPGIGIQQIADDMDITLAIIKQWVREERLEFSNPASAGFTCESCGTPINTGRFCSHCKGKLTDRLESAYEKDTPKKQSIPKDSAKMRFINR